MDIKMKLKFLMREIPVIDPTLSLDGYRLVLYNGGESYIISVIGKNALAYVRTSSNAYQELIERNETKFGDWVLYEVKKL